MKKRYLALLLFYFGLVFGQNIPNSFAIDANYFTGNILKHAPDLGPLITGHPEGFLVSFSKKTYGNEEWERVYNYPDFGVYLLYQDFKNQYLGSTYAVGLHYNFYFLNRKLVFKISDGIAMVSNPHDNEFNNKNIAFGSKFLGNVNLGLNYKTKIIDHLSLQSGFMFTHFSNARIKSPNRGINTFNVNLGLTYDLDKNGNQINNAGENNGSCKIFAFALLQQFTKEETLSLFGDFYQDVLNSPEASDHQNIRNFMIFGWNGIHFEGAALEKK